MTMITTTTTVTDMSLLI